jgi:hypothetical protein
MSQADFVEACRTATETLFAQRKASRKAIRFAFTPEGLWIATGVTYRENGEMQLARHLTIPWERLATMEPEALVAQVDQLCADPTVPFRSAH